MKILLSLSLVPQGNTAARCFYLPVMIAIEKADRCFSGHYNRRLDILIGFAWSRVSLDQTCAWKRDSTPTHVQAGRWRGYQDRARTGCFQLFPSSPR